MDLCPGTHAKARHEESAKWGSADQTDPGKGRAGGHKALCNVLRLLSVLRKGHGNWFAEMVLAYACLRICLLEDYSSHLHSQKCHPLSSNPLASPLILTLALLDPGSSLQKS